MAYKDKQKTYDYNNKFNKENYDRINLCLPKNTKAKLKEVASKHNESVNSYINEAIRQRMEASNNNTNEVKSKNKTKAVLLSILLAAFLIVLFAASLYIDVAPNVPIAIFFCPIGVGYFFGDIVKSFYKRLIKGKAAK